MNLEQVKEHFKYAKEVRCLVDGKIYDLTKITERGFYTTCIDNFQFEILDGSTKRQCMVFRNEPPYQLAEILTYIFDCGEEVEVSCAGTIWSKARFIAFWDDNTVICEDKNGSIFKYNHIRKLTPESLLEPQLSELKKTAEANGMSVEIIFKQK